FVQDDLIRKGEAIICYVPTDDMVVDILYQPLIWEQHWKLVQGMGLQMHLSGSDK
ncbi:hypothetical protein PAXRUDRAFT_126736, partial [Paxillus rubicundulus Ve08.2h10]